MKTLYHSLIDYDMALLKAIAKCRGMTLTTSNKDEAVRLVTEALLSPAATAIALVDLSAPETEALQFLLDNDGRVEGPRFARQYGSVRPMGPARLEREQPWQNPAAPAEGLWYRGLIFKTFQLTGQGNLEMVYIPTDLLSLLEITWPKSTAKMGPSPGNQAEAFRVSQLPLPSVVVNGHNRLRENFFNLLVYLQTTPVRLQADEQLSSNDKRFLIGCLLPPLLPTFTLEAELEFLLHLGKRAGLLVTRHGRLKPERDTTRAWLQASPTEQTLLLQNTWRADPTWNDLWHVPGLVPQPTGWENSPLLGRSKILEFLSQLAPSQDSWFSLEDFVAAVKRIEPDFQRPDGDYESWYIQAVGGGSLMGFSNWEKVEGEFMRHLITHVLLCLEAIELGMAAPHSHETHIPTSFKLTPLGKAFLSGQATSAPPHKPPLPLRIETNLYTYVPDRASLYDRFQLARFAELHQREENRVVYHITQASVSRALRNGVTTDQITAFLARATNNQIPLKVVETLRTWARRCDTVRLESATLLHLKHEELLAELRQHPVLNSLLGEQISSQVLLVPPHNVAEVRRLLKELGYLA